MNDAPAAGGHGGQHAARNRLRSPDEPGISPAPRHVPGSRPRLREPIARLSDGALRVREDAARVKLVCTVLAGNVRSEREDRKLKRPSGTRDGTPEGQESAPRQLYLGVQMDRMQSLRAYLEELERRPDHPHTID